MGALRCDWLLVVATRSLNLSRLHMLTVHMSLQKIISAQELQLLT